VWDVFAAVSTTGGTLGTTTAALSSGDKVSGTTPEETPEGIYWAPTLLTILTLPSGSVISNSATLDSETKSIKVLSFLKSIKIRYFKLKKP
jgi:hypothetical protein